MNEKRRPIVLCRDCGHGRSLHFNTTTNQTWPMCRGNEKKCRCGKTWGDVTKEADQSHCQHPRLGVRRQKQQLAVDYFCEACGKVVVTATGAAAMPGYMADPRDVWAEFVCQDKSDVRGTRSR